MIAIIDYGAGNLFSVKNALDFLGLPNLVTKSAQDLLDADHIILPGVGAFADAMGMLNATGLVDTIKAQAHKKPFLGICVGMQLLFETGYEFGVTKGLGLIPGEVRLLQTGGLKVPHMGWNELAVQTPCPLTETLQPGDYVYFVHSYGAVCPGEFISASCEYGSRIPALVHSGNLYGAQFHPEKSGRVGLAMLKKFGELKPI